MKSFSPLRDKIFLENLIFYRATLTGSDIYARQGLLKSCKPVDSVLKCLLDLYNIFFERENKKLTEEEDIYWNKAEKIHYEDFIKQKRINFTLPAYGIFQNK